MAVVKHKVEVTVAILDGPLDIGLFDRLNVNYNAVLAGLRYTVDIVDTYT
jgi:hypothetical protein